MTKQVMHISLTFLMGQSVHDHAGIKVGLLKDIAVATGADAGKVAGLVLKVGKKRMLVQAHDVRALPEGGIELAPQALLEELSQEDNFLLLQQDLMDRQIIDVYGRKVVRVNDVDLQWVLKQGEQYELRVAEVEVGTRGAVRRILKGIIPRSSLEQMSRFLSPRVIPWEFVDVIEVDPARRVRLKIEHERLASMHPSDLADILEELAPAERDAVFSTLDDEIAAEALEEVDPRLQKSLLQSLNSEQVADIVEEMDPGAAADLLAELPEERSEQILEEMDPVERQEVEELLEFDEESAAGRMTTEYVWVYSNASVQDAVDALTDFDGDSDTVTDIYVIDEKEELIGDLPIGRLLGKQPSAPIAPLINKDSHSCKARTHQKEVAELFDKYNLRSMPVLNENAQLVGVILADHVIAFLRERR